MGKTDTVVFTLHKKYNQEARKTIGVLHKVLQGIIDEQSYSKLDPGLTPRQTPELEAMHKQENDYLDGFLNLQHYSEIELTKKRKMDDDTIGARTAVSGLTNVSPQSNASTSNIWNMRNVQRRTVATNQETVPMDYKTAETERLEELE